MPVCVSLISNESNHRDKIPTIWKMKNWRKSAGLCNKFGLMDMKYIFVFHIYLYFRIFQAMSLIQPDMLNCKPNLK